MFRTMCYQKLIVGSLKAAQVHVKLNSFMMNICRLSSQNNIFVNRFSQVPIIKRSYYSNNHNFHRQKIRKYFIISSGMFFSLFDFGQPEEEEIPELIMTLKRSVLLIQKGEFKKAEQMLHIALRQAQTLQHYEGITYVYDVMANLAFDTEEYKKAETLFKSVLQRLLSTGTLQNDLRVIHISLKLANIYENTKDLQKAEDGYKFCIQHLRDHIAKDTENEDVTTLLGMSLDWYAHMLFRQSKYKEALQCLLEAYNISKKINGEEHEQTVILLNDLGIIHYSVGQYEEAFEYLSTAAKIGKKVPDMVNLGSIHVNLGNIFIQRGLYDKAKKHCTKGKNIAKSRKDDNSIVEAEKCLKKLEELMS